MTALSAAGDVENPFDPEVIEQRAMIARLVKLNGRLRRIASADAPFDEDLTAKERKAINAAAGKLVDGPDKLWARWRHGDEAERSAVAEQIATFEEAASDLEQALAASESDEEAAAPVKLRIDVKRIGGGYWAIVTDVKGSGQLKLLRAATQDQARDQAGKFA